MSEQSNGQGMAVASLVMGILAWLGHCCCCCVGPLLAILAIIFGYSARSSMRGNGTSAGWGLATAGIVLGWLYFLLALIWFMIWFVLCFALPCAAAAPFACLWHL